MTRPYKTVEANGLGHAYLEDGPSDGAPVLLLHGFPDHAPSFRHQMPALAAEGYRVLAPWLRGYAPTALAPDGVYTSDALVADAAGLIDALAGGRAHVVGHDWGAVVGYGLAAAHPEKVASLTAIAIPHPAKFGMALLGGDYDQLRRSWYMFFFQMAGLADAVVPADNFRFIDRLWEDWSPGYRRSAEEKAELDECFAQPGVVQAALGYYRAMFSGGGGGAAPIPMATTVIFGADDGCVSPALCEGMEGFFPGGVQVEVIPGAGHFVHLEKPDDVTRLILERIRAA